VGTVGGQEQPHPFLYCGFGGGDSVRGGLDLSRQPAFRFLRGTQLPTLAGDVGQQPVEPRDRLRLPVGDGLGLAPGPGENVGRQGFGGSQVGGIPVGGIERRDGRLVLIGAARAGGGVRGLA